MSSRLFPIRAAHLERLLAISQRWPSLSLCVLTILAFAPVKLALLSGQMNHGSRIWLFLAISLVAVLFLQLRASDLAKPVRLTLRGIGLLFALYLAFAYSSTLRETIGDWAYFELLLYRFAGAILFCVGLWRPALMLPAFVAARYQKLSFSDASGLPITFTDYTPVVEFGCLLTLGSCLLWLGQKRYDLWRENSKSDWVEPIEAVYLTAVAAHFANYFYSAVQKILISDSLWQWIAENPTQNLTLAAWERGNLPLTILGEGATGFLYQVAASNVGVLNLTVLLMQLGAVVAITRVRWTIVLTALYDVTHVAIFLLSGIFFYKWIWLNLLIVVSLSMIANKIIPRHIQLWLIAVVLLAPGMFFVARLGWFDTPSFNDEYVEAVIDDGRAYRVPDSYFLSTSVTHAQQRLLPQKPGHFLTGAYGALYGEQTSRLPFHDALNCQIEKPSPQDFEQAIANRNLDRYILAHANFVRHNLNEAGQLNYDLYPHHIFSMPWEFSEFHDLDKRRIVGYRYVVESKCLSFEDGRPQAKVLARGEHYVPIPHDNGQ
jgi:hypothetical protein